MLSAEHKTPVDGTLCELVGFFCVISVLCWSSGNFNCEQVSWGTIVLYKVGKYCIQYDSDTVVAQQINESQNEQSNGNADHGYPLLLMPDCPIEVKNLNYLDLFLLWLWLAVREMCSMTHGWDEENRFQAVKRKSLIN